MQLASRSLNYSRNQDMDSRQDVVEDLFEAKLLSLKLSLVNNLNHIVGETLSHAVDRILSRGASHATQENR